MHKVCAALAHSNFNSTPYITLYFTHLNRAVFFSTLSGDVVPEGDPSYKLRCRRPPCPRSVSLHVPAGDSDLLQVQALNAIAVIHA